MHCPVSLGSGIKMVGEFRVGCNKTSVRIQDHSTHHVKYEGGSMCRGSSGGGVYIHNSTFVFGMHVEAINEADFECEESMGVVAPNAKRVDSEDISFPTMSTSQPAKKTKKIDCETIVSIAGGNNGRGSALIFCMFPRLMQYINELENSIP
jgi:hypothetical protein